ncbi:radical SAM domain protein [Chitinispirillum alkaliphilum]|nr:radical SAM domain protein [Chitinispirillum alkaliphilum]
MIRQIFILIRILLDRKITTVPLSVLKELRKKGIRRLPVDVDRKLNRGLPALSSVRFLHSWLGSEMITRHNDQWVINSFTPPFPGASFNRAFENLRSGRRYNPISCFVALTKDCSYDCWHCSVQTRRNGNLSTKEWLSAIGELNNIGLSIIGFTGGEPLSREDLPEIIRAASNGGASTILFTSGAGLDARKAAQLKDAGLWAICISLDTPDKDLYNKMRGSESAFDNAVKAVQLSKEANLYTMIGAVATREFVEKKTYLPLYDYIRSLGVQELRIVEPMPCGKLKADSQDHLLTEEHTKTIRDFHRNVNRKGKLPKVCAFNQIESPEVFGCSGGIQHLYIDTAGEVCPCDFTPLSFGNVTQENLSSIIDRMSEALGGPRCDCMLQKHHTLFSSYYDQGYPLPVETSLEICKKLPQEALPGYYKMVSGR